MLYDKKLPSLKDKIREDAEKKEEVVGPSISKTKKNKEKKYENKK